MKMLSKTCLALILPLSLVWACGSSSEVGNDSSSGSGTSSGANSSGASLNLGGDGLALGGDGAGADSSTGGTLTGTGGTLAGIARFLKSGGRNVKTYLADPQGSALYNWVEKGDLKVEGPASITEGIGTTRVTANLADTPLDGAVHILDADTVRHVYRLLREEGLYLGSTSGVNVAAAVQVAKQLGPGHTIVTILCDSGVKYQSRLFNKQWLADKGLATAAGV